MTYPFFVRDAVKRIIHDAAVAEIVADIFGHHKRVCKSAIGDGRFALEKHVGVVVVGVFLLF